MANRAPEQEFDAIVSIVIINHNYASYLSDAIESALNQTYKNIEIIVVDDGSTDGSGEIASRYIDRLILISQENLGHSAALNTGFETCIGKFVIFLDADDILYPECVEHVLSAWRPDYSKIQFQLDTIDSRGIDQKMPFPFFAKNLSSDSIEKQALKTGWHPWTVSSGNLFSRQFLQALLPLDHEAIYRSPDGYLCKLAPLFGKVGVLRQVLGAYRVHGANAWAATGAAWDVGTALRWLRFNDVLEGAFVGCAISRGFPIELPLISSFHQLEYRLLVLRFAPEEFEAVSGKKIDLLIGTFRWLLYTLKHDLFGAIARTAWLLFLAVMPKSIIKAQLMKARAQSGRSPFWSKMLRITRRA